VNDNATKEDTMGDENWKSENWKKELMSQEGIKARDYRGIANAACQAPTPAKATELLDRLAQHLGNTIQDLSRRREAVLAMREALQGVTPEMDEAMAQLVPGY
jgi:hypothetical protein